VPVYSGPYPSIHDKLNNRYETRIIGAYVPSRPFLGGTHQLNIGTVEDWEPASTRVLTDKVSGDYPLRQCDCHELPHGSKLRAGYKRFIPEGGPLWHAVQFLISTV